MTETTPEEEKMVGDPIHSPLQGETNSYASGREEEVWTEYGSITDNTTNNNNHYNDDDNNNNNSNSVRVIHMQELEGGQGNDDGVSVNRPGIPNGTAQKTTSIGSSSYTESVEGMDSTTLAQEDPRVQAGGDNDDDYDPENEILEFWNTSFIISTIASHIPEKHVFDEEPATPTFFPTRHHHHFFPDTAEVLEDEDFTVASPNAAASASTHSDEPELVVRRTRKQREEEEEEEEEEDEEKEEEGDQTKKASRKQSQVGVVDGSAELGKATSTAKSAAHASHSHRIRIIDSVAYPPKDAVTTTQKNLICWGKALPLYSIIDIPHWQRYNPAIRGSYRAFYNTSMTIKSFLGWHNETLNIWTHFSGFLLFLYLTYFLCTRTLHWEGAFSSYLNSAPIFYYLFCLGCMGCTICSTIYHLFTGHCNCKLMVLMGRIDFVGITFLIIGSFLPPLYVLLHCFPMLRNIYLTASIVLGAATSFACWTDTFFEHVGIRVGLFVGLAVSGVGPLIHLLFMVPFSDTMASIVYGIFLMLALYGSGVVFYVSRFPEAWFPSHFDCFLSSHQIWHYFVMMAAIVHFFNCTSIYQMYTMSDGNC